MKRWSAQQVATHRRRANRTVDSGTLRAITIADDLEEAYASDLELVNLVRRVRREKLTNIGRLFSADVMTALHLLIGQDGEAVRDRTLMARHRADQLHAVFIWAFELLAEKSVDAFKNPQIRAVRLAEIRDLIPNIADGVPEYRRLTDAPFGTHAPAEAGVGESELAEADEDDDVDTFPPDSKATGPSTQQGGSASTSISTDGRSPESPRRSSEPKPPQYLFQGLKLHNHPQRIRDLLRECRKLEIEAFPGITCVMARVLVELAVSQPAALAHFWGARVLKSQAEDRHDAEVPRSGH